MDKNNFLDVKKAVDMVTTAFEEHDKVVNESIKTLRELGTVYKTAVPSDYLSQLQRTSSLLDAQNKQLLATQKIAKETANAENARSRADASKARAEIALNAKRKSEIKLQEEEARKIAKTSGEYQKISTRIRELTSEYNNLAVKKARGVQLSASEEQRLLRLTQLTNGYNGVLKKVDATIGKHQRNVGNYASSWDGLQFQTNQLIREIPAAAYGLNVFFGAIGNNLPMFIDEVNNARAANAALISQGKEAPSVFSRVVSSIFNWQTALIGLLTYLTLNGKEVSNWIRSLWGASDALDDLTKAQLAYNKSREQSLLATQQDTSFLEQQLRIAQDTNLSLDVRAEAVKKLRKEYEYHTKTLTDNNILDGETGDLVERITKALEARSKALKTQATLDNNKARVIALQEELRLREEYESRRATLLREQNIYEKNSIANRLRNANLSAQERKDLELALRDSKNELSDLEKLEKARRKERDALDDTTLSHLKSADIQKEIQAIQIENLWYQKSINDLEKVGSELDIREEKERAGRERNKDLADEVDYLASVYKLRMQISGILSRDSRRDADDNELNIDKRAVAVENYYTQERVQLWMTYEEKNRLRKNEYDAEVLKYRKFIAEGRATNEQLTALYHQYIVDRRIIDNEYEDSKNQLAVKKAQELQETLKKMQSNIADNSLAEFSNNLIENEANISKIFSNMATEMSDIAKLSNDIRELNKERSQNESQRRQIEMKSVRDEIAAIEEKNNGDLKSNEKILELRGKLLTLTKEELSEVLRVQKEIDSVVSESVKNTQAQLNNAITSFVSNTSFKGLGSFFEEEIYKYVNADGEIVEKAGTRMQMLLDQARTGSQKLQIIATETLGVFASFADYQRQAINQQFDNELNALEKQKAIAIKFAGESTEARAEVEEQYQIRRAELMREQAKKDREFTLFQATIDLASAIVASLKKPWTTAAIAAIGAAQIAMISSTPLPQFYAGGTHDGGLMMVNDGRGANYRETIVMPNGKILRPQGRNVVMNAPKGTEIYTHDQWDKQMRGMMFGNSVTHAKKGTDDDRFSKGMEALARGLSNQRGVEINIDKNGLQTMMKRNGERVKMVNSRIKLRN